MMPGHLLLSPPRSLWQYRRFPIFDKGQGAVSALSQVELEHWPRYPPA